MDIDPVRNAKWRRWSSGIFRAVARRQEIGLYTRSSANRGDLYAALQTDLAVYRSLLFAKLPGYDPRRHRRLLANERRSIRTLVRRIREECGDRVWWTIRRDGTGIDLLVAGESRSPAKAAVTARLRSPHRAQAAGLMP